MVGWNLFKSIAHAVDHAVKSFEHIVKDLGPFGVVLAASLGLPELATGAAVTLLMKAHAGDAGAKAHVKTVLARGGNWPTYMNQMAAKLKAHPDFARFSQHAKATNAAVHGLHESLGRGRRPAPPTGQSADQGDESVDAG